jgi:hypothetical protein
MSCISRAIRARSADVAICACWSRSISRRRARSCQAKIVSRRARRTSPAAHTTRAVSDAITARIAALTGSEKYPVTSRVAASTAAPTMAPRIAVRCAQRGPWTVTEYRAMRTARSAGMTSGEPSTVCSSPTA